MYWLEILEEAGLVKEDRIKELKKEVDEIAAMVVSSIITSRNKLKK